MIGAAFVIGLQIAAILSYGTISRVSLLQSQVLLAHMPDLQSVDLVAGARRAWAMASLFSACSP